MSNDHVEDPARAGQVHHLLVVGTQPVNCAWCAQLWLVGLGDHVPVCGQETQPVGHGPWVGWVQVLALLGSLCWAADRPHLLPSDCGDH